MTFTYPFGNKNIIYCSLGTLCILNERITGYRIETNAESYRIPLPLFNLLDEGIYSYIKGVGVLYLQIRTVSFDYHLEMGIRKGFENDQLDRDLICNNPFVGNPLNISTHYGGRFRTKNKLDCISINSCFQHPNTMFILVSYLTDNSELKEFQYLQPYILGAKLKYQAYDNEFVKRYDTVDIPNFKMKNRIGFFIPVNRMNLEEFIKLLSSGKKYETFIELDKRLIRWPRFLDFHLDIQFSNSQPDFEISLEYLEIDRLIFDKKAG